MKKIILLILMAACSSVAYAKNCTKGQPCGNSCISWSYTCHIGTTTTVKYPPTASFTLSQSGTTAPTTVVLDATNSYALSSVINIFQWSASNGQSYSGKNTSIMLNEPGTYTITLTVTDGNGLTATSQKIGLF